MIKSIVLIGSGNVATHLGLALKKSGSNIIQVYSPNATHASALAKKLKTNYCNKMEAVSKEADLYIMAVKDDVIKDICEQLDLKTSPLPSTPSTTLRINSERENKIKNKIFVHTSGSAPMDVLKKASKNIGVFYPLQTFSKNREVDFSQVPFCIEANNKSTEKLLVNLAKTISLHVSLINSPQRKTLHVAAVFACNFTNHLFAISEKILNDHKLSFDILKPLIYETIYKIEKFSPQEMQTGPAKRKDKKTIQSHLEFLNDYPEYKKIYKRLSDNIEKG